MFLYTQLQQGAKLVARPATGEGIRRVRQQPQRLGSLQLWQTAVFDRKLHGPFAGEKGRANSRNVWRVSDGCTCLRLIIVRLTVIAVITER